MTAKHTNTYNYLQKSSKSSSSKKSTTTYNCKCGKIYAYRQSLYTHRKICNIYEKKSHQRTKQRTFVTLTLKRFELLHSNTFLNVT